MSAGTLARDLVIAQTQALKMPGVARTFEALARQARDAHWPHEDYLHEVRPSSMNVVATITIVPNAVKRIVL